jgi:hypothetical protein
LQSLPFRQPGRFYRGNLHTHSTRSDGGLGPAEVVTSYRERGYDFLAITDHFLASYGFPLVDTREYRTERFTTLLGAELHAPQTHLGDLWHIVAVGLPLDFARPSAGESGPELSARAAAAGAFVGIAHPAWYSISVEDALSLEAAHAVEVYNETTVTLNDRGDSWYMSDQLSLGGRQLLAYAADDAHFVGRPDVGRAWVQVRAERLDPEDLLAALKAGHFYSSQGPEIHDVTIVGDRIQIHCTPASAVLVSGAGSRAARLLGADLTRADLPLAAFAGSFCRVTVVDAHGRRAWSNPIWLD